MVVLGVLGGKRRKGPIISNQPHTIGKCEILSKLGEGGMGVVYKGRHADLDLDVAVKVLAAHLAGREDMSGRFLREARLAARIDHTGVVRILDCGQEDDRYYMVMEFVDGRSLQDLIDERGSIPVLEALGIVRAVADALGAAQAQVGIIHRDIKPDNVMLTGEGKIKVADFGLAKVVADQQQQTIEGATAAGVAMGTPHYMSPEQCTDARSVDHRADIYSLGATFYYMLSGGLPFGGETLFALMRNVVEVEPRPLPESIPVPVRTLVFKMMAKKPEERHQTYDELVREIDRTKGLVASGVAPADGTQPTLVGAGIEGADEPSAYGLRSTAAPAPEHTMPLYDVSATDGRPGPPAPARKPADTAATYPTPGLQSGAGAPPPSGGPALPPTQVEHVAAAVAAPSVAEAEAAAAATRSGRGGAAGTGRAVLVLLLLAAAGGGLYWAHSQGYFEKITGERAGEDARPPAAGPVFGRIAATEGAVEFRRGDDGDWETLRAADCLRPGDRLRTGSSRARVAFSSGGGVFVDRFSLLQCVKDEGKPPGVTLESGGLYAETVPADKGFWVETPHGRAVDFGTRFTVEIREDGVHIVVAEGKVEVSTDAGRVEILAGNEVVITGRDEKPGEVKVVINVDDRLAWAAGLRQIEKDLVAKREAAFRKAMAAADSAERAKDIEGAVRHLERALDQKDDAEVAKRLAGLKDDIRRSRAEAEGFRAETAARAKDTKTYERLAGRVRGMTERGEFDAAVAAVEAVRPAVSTREVAARVDALLGEVRAAEVEAGKMAEKARLERERAGYAKLVESVRALKAGGEFAAGHAVIEAFKDTVESDVIRDRVGDLLAELTDAEAVSKKTVAERKKAEEERLARQREAFKELAAQAREMKAKAEFAVAAVSLDAFRQTVESKDLLAEIDALLAEIRGAEEAHARSEAARLARETKAFEALAAGVRGMKERREFVAALASVDAFRPTVESEDIRRKLDDLEAEVKAAEADARAGALAAASTTAAAGTGAGSKTGTGAGHKPPTTGGAAAATETVTTPPAGAAAWEDKGFVALTEHKGWVKGLTFTPDGGRLVTGSADRTANLWEVSTGELVRTFGMHGDAINSVAVSPDGRYLATAGSDKIAALWDLATGRRLRNFTGHTDKVYAVAFSPDGRRLVTGSKDETAIIWDVEKGRIAAKCRPKQHFVNSVAYAPSGKYVVTGLAQRVRRKMLGGAVLWEVETGEGQKSFREEKGFVTSVAFSPDGRYIAAGDLNLRYAVLWEVETGRRIRSFSGHAKGVWSVAFSPDGKRLATASDDGTAALYEVASAKRIQPFKGHSKGVIAVALSPDGRYLATGSQDNTARIWKIGE